MTFDPKRRLVMANFKTVLGHSLPVGTQLTITDEPKERGEVDQAMATRLFTSRNAVYAEDLRPSPVETPEQERARLALEALRDAPADQVTPTDDLVAWQADDAETGKKTGDKVTNDDLRAIAAREGAPFETDDNKPDLQRKIMERRAARAANLTYSGTAEGVGTGDGAASGSTGAGTGRGAGAGLGGDAHGDAGEGTPDEAE